MGNNNKIPYENIQRIESLEKKYGIEKMNIFAYTREKELVVNGEIFGESLKDEIEIICSVYNNDGDIIASAENNSYSSGLVTSYIKPECFKGIFPFSINVRIPRGQRIGKIRVYPRK